MTQLHWLVFISYPWSISLVGIHLGIRYLKSAKYDQQQEPFSSRWVTVRELSSIAGDNEGELEQFSAVFYVNRVMRAKLLWNISVRSNVLEAGKGDQRQFGN